MLTTTIKLYECKVTFIKNVKPLIKNISISSSVDISQIANTVSAFLNKEEINLKSIKKIEVTRIKSIELEIK